MDKFATYQFQGKADAFTSMGLSPEVVSALLVQDGMSKEAADAMIKEALPIAGLIGGGLRAAGKFLAPRAANLARAGASKAMAPARAGAQGLLGRGAAGAQQAIGRAGLQAGRGLASAGRAFQAAPMRTLGRGAMEAGKGALFMGGKGLGGTVGKGIFAGTMASSLMGPGQVQMPQAYGGITRPPGQY